MTRLPLLAVALTLAACQAPAEDTAPTPPEAPSLPAAPATPTSEGSAPTAPVSPATPGSAQADADASDACGATKVARFVGQEATVPVRSQVARESGASTDRWIYPDSMVTEDFSATRLNVVMDKATNTIVSMRCG